MDGNVNRIAVFASCSSDGRLPPQVLPYVAGLKSVAGTIIVVCDNDLEPDAQDDLCRHADHVIARRHGECDFGSYKRGVAWACEQGLLGTADALILCDDSCFGPVGSFLPMFRTMEARGLDFWGATDSHELGYHLQRYFMVLHRRAFQSEAFRGFMDGVGKPENVSQAILNYDLGMTKALRGAGFTAGAMVENTLKGVHPADPSYRDLTIFPLYTLGQGLPLVKVKALRKPHANTDGPNRVLAWLKRNARDTYDVATSDFDILKFEGADQIAFSLIMPTHNRAWCISKAIASVLAQTHRNFELIIVDDGSNDGTQDVVAREFYREIKSGKITYIYLSDNLGVSRARNIGLSIAKNTWIGYTDSDNKLRPYFLAIFANLIIENTMCDTFYGKIIKIQSGSLIGSNFNKKNLLSANYIDIGVFIHKRSLFGTFGGFDEELRRLVDWDLIIRYTAHKDPIFIPIVALEYTDSVDHKDRISVRESFLKASVAVHAKHGLTPAISTVILGYNHVDYITEAIESALSQEGEYKHEILLSDDGSVDGTSRIMARYAQKHPKRIRDISRGKNFGISENYRHCFREAAGEYIAVLEGDDYWSDPRKNEKQATFLRTHVDATMVFSRVELLNMADRSQRLLKRQDGLPALFDATEFARNEHLNLIANFSSCMFRGDIMRDLPPLVYQPRLNEITLSFYLDRLGKFGFLDQVMGVYRLHEASIWTGASKASRLRQSIDIRESALRIAKSPHHRRAIQQRLDEKRNQLVNPDIQDKQRS